MYDDARFDPQGEGYNALPHLLVATLDPDWRDGMRWSIQCPYEGSGRPCALLIECTEHSRPYAPDRLPSWLSSPEIDEEVRAEEEVVERWEDDHPHGAHHSTDQCWVGYYLTEGDYEPEYFLRSMPKGHVISGPMRVQIGRVGYGEEAEPVVRLWDDNTSGDENR